MELLVPKYYPKFKCVAERCRHNCCIGWEIDIDEETLAKYRALTGEAGAWVRESIEENEEGAHFRLAACERCANLDERGLCRIISTLGEGYLCEICREHPRFYHCIGNLQEGGLGAACEEAARLILGEEDYATPVHPDGTPAEIPPKTGGDFDTFAWRTALYGTLSDKALPYLERRQAVRERYAQPLLLEGEELVRALDELEYLDEAHRALLLEAAAKATATPPPEAERFLAYLVYRYASLSLVESDFRLSVSFALQLERLFCALVAGMGLSPVEAARILSEEVEYSETNVAALRFAIDVENAFFG